MVCGARTVELANRGPGFGQPRFASCRNPNRTYARRVNAGVLVELDSAVLGVGPALLFPDLVKNTARFYRYWKTPASAKSRLALFCGENPRRTFSPLSLFAS